VPRTPRHAAASGSAPKHAAPDPADLDPADPHDTVATLGDLPANGEDLSLDPKRWLALAVIAVAQLMVILDATIVNIALPQAQLALGISDADRQWMVTAYALPFGALLLLGGRIADYVGRKKILIIALSGFAIASAIGGAAQVGWQLFIARALQGVFAAMLAPAALSLVTVTFHAAKERAKAFAVFGAISGGGAAVGLLLGGVLTEYASWRWCLFVNIPIAIFAVLAAIPVLRESKVEGGTHYDIPGAVLATAGLGTLVWAFTQPAEHGWGSINTIGWLAVSIVLLAVFVLVELKSSSPLLPMRILENRNRAGAYVVGLLVGAGLFAVFLFLTYYLQGVLLYTPIQAGFAFLPFSVGIIIGAGIGSQLTLRAGPRFVVPAGLFLAMVGMFWLSRINVDTTYFGTILWAMLIIAIGMGFIFMSTTNVALVGVSHDDAGVASAVVSTSQQVGGSIGTALLNTIALSATATFALANLPQGTTPDVILAAQNAAAVHGYGVAFMWSSIIFAVAIAASLILINAGKDQVADVESVPGV
jgi:EmrB/QacA subfamily drug resistance transporter